MDLSSLRPASAFADEKVDAAEGSAVWENSEIADPSPRKTTYREIEPLDGDGARDDKSKRGFRLEDNFKAVEKAPLNPSLQQVRSFACMQHLLCS